MCAVGSLGAEEHALNNNTLENRLQTWAMDNLALIMQGNFLEKF
jgi:hypothetical protein